MFARRVSVRISHAFFVTWECSTQGWKSDILTFDQLDTPASFTRILQIQQQAFKACSDAGYGNQRVDARFTRWLSPRPL